MACTNIFDFLEGDGIPYHVSDPARSETENLAAIREDIEREAIDFAFVYLPALDGLLHMVGNDSPRIHEKLAWYDEQLAQLLAIAQQHYEDVHLYIFSDHGMANCTRLIDLRSKIDPLPIKMGEDYVVVYDSTMARFWFFNDQARKLVTDALAQVPEGRVLPDKELKELGTFFPDHHFGELIFLVREGTLIVPSFMGERPIRAMHGYHPSEPQSYAALLTNQSELPVEATDIPHMCRLMKAEATHAFSQNHAASLSACAI